MPDALQPQAGFDYDSLDEVTRERLQQKTSETHMLLKQTTEHILSIGKNLKAIKEELPHGQFLLWIQAEFGMSRWTAHNFMQVADRLEDKWRNFHHLPISVLYQLAAPATSDEILEQVQTGEIPPHLEAIRAAKEAERQAREAQRQAQDNAENIHQQLVALNTATQQKQERIAQLSQEIRQLKEHMDAQASPAVEIREVEKVVVPPEMQAHITTLQEQLHTSIQQRDALSQRVTQLSDEAKEAARKHHEGEQERSIRLNWYRVTNEFRTGMTKLLSQWPSPLDTVAFEADDWTRLSHTKELARRFLEACTELTQEKIIEGGTTPTHHNR